MNKKILISLSAIGVVAAIAIGGTIAYFSDTETSTGNTLTAGVIDIVVDDENPWTKTFTDKLTDMKPSYTRYIEFVVRNLEKSNEVVLWKHIDITGRSGGTITEPECEEEGGVWTGTGCINDSQHIWVPRDNLDPYIIYDMWVCEDPEEAGRCETDGVTSEPIYNTGWTPIITEYQYVRLDNVSSAWIKIGQLVPATSLKVVQSYHLSSWPGAPEPEVTNWAQGDTLTFDIELMATQMNAPGPKGYFATLNMDNKDPVTWVPIADSMSGILTYNTSGGTFNYSFAGAGLQNISYSLIYYADPWPGNNPGALIGSGVAAGGNLSLSGSPELNMDLPAPSDANFPAGAKIWLVPSSDYDGTKLTAWNPTNYLFEMNLIQYDDTGI